LRASGYNAAQKIIEKHTAKLGEKYLT
jgi:hypothetical protein